MIIALHYMFDMFYTRREYLHFSKMELKTDFAVTTGI
jgi:hypothetical protein